MQEEINMFGADTTDYHSSLFSYFGFQPEAVNFLVEKKKCILALPTGLGKTVISLSAYATLKQSNPKLKCIFITDKSVIQQSIKSLHRFFNLKVDYLYEDTPRNREKMYRHFERDLDILVINYAVLRNDFSDFEEVYDTVGGDNICLVYDEANYITGETSKLHAIAKGMASLTAYVFCLSATPTKGRLEELYNMLVILGKNKNSKIGFYKHYVDFEQQIMCNMKIGNKKIATSIGFLNGDTYSIKFNLQKLFGGTQHKVVSDHDNIKCESGVLHAYFDESYSGYLVYGVNIKYILKSGKKKTTRVLLHFFPKMNLKGYKNLNKFKKRHLDVLYSKSKKEVAPDLPPFTKIIRTVEHDESTIKAIAKIYEDTANSAQLRIALAYPQYVEEAGISLEYVNNKMAMLITLIENDIEGQTIIYSPSKNVINFCNWLLLKQGYTTALITGDITKTREQEKERFIEGHARFILITDAGGVGVDGLQVSNNIVFMGLPNTGGQLSQICGRVSRIGTVHTQLNLFFVLTKDSNDVDSYEAVMSQIHLMYLLDRNSIDEGLVDEDVKAMTESESDKFIKAQIKGRRTQYLSWSTKLENSSSKKVRSKSKNGS